VRGKVDFDAMKRDDFYQRLRERITNWAAREGRSSSVFNYILLAPDFFHLLCKLMFDPRVPGREKKKLGAAIAYFISPVDLIPEGLVGPAGYVDDVALAAYILHSILNSVGADVLREHWAGDSDVLDKVHEVLNVADRLVGSGMWKKIKGLIK